MTRRTVPAIALLLLLAMVAAACGAVAPSPVAPNPDAPSPVAPGTPAAPQGPNDGAGPDGDIGNVDADVPELTVQTEPDGGLRVALIDPSAKAWRLTFLGADPADRLELEVFTSDVEPTIVVREIRAGVVVDEADLSAFAGDPTVAAGGCHGTIGVCYGSGEILLPADGSGELGIVVALVDPSAVITITGSTAGWPGEPFVLGPWRDTLPFTPAG